MKFSKLANGLAFLTGTFSLVTVQIAGLVTLSECLALICLCFFILNPKPELPAFKKNRLETVRMIAVWIIGVALSDIYNGSTTANTLKGLGHPIFILITFLYLQRLFQLSKNALHYFIAGLCLGSILYYLTTPWVQENFRFGMLAIIINFGTFAGNYYWKRGEYKKVYLLFAVLAMIGLAGGGRSNFLMVGGGLLLLYLIEKNKNKRFDYNPKKLGTIVIISVAAVFVIQEAYVLAVENKLFPTDYQEKFEKQLATGLPVILSGRSEIFSSSAAIYDSPIFGHGSWASNPKYAILYLEATKNDESEANQEVLKEGRIPAHSFIFSAWVENGLLSMVFFLFFGKRILNLVVYYFNNRSRAEVPFMAYVIVTYLWHLLFSPLGYDKRIFVTLILAMNAYYIFYLQNKNKVKPPARQPAAIN